MGRSGRLNKSFPSSLLLWKLLPELEVSGNWTLSFHRLLEEDTKSDRKGMSPRQSSSSQTYTSRITLTDLGVGSADLLPGMATKALLKGLPEYLSPAG